MAASQPAIDKKTVPSLYRVFRPHPALYQQRRRASLPGLILGAGLLGFLGLMLGALLFMQDGSPDFTDFSAYIFSRQTWFVISSAAFQAVLSAVMSILVGAACARALFRRGYFRGRSSLLILSFLAMIMPSTVAAVSLLSLWGRKGVLRQGFEAVFPTDFLFAPYGLAMVVLAHMFFNAPLVMRVCFAGLQSVPQSQLRLAAQLGFTARDYWRWIELPCIKACIPSLFGLIFLMCFSSFSLVLMLGGGPSVSTLEVAIYTAVRFEFDLPKAGVLALMQLGVSALIILSLSRFEHLSWTTRLADQASVPRKDKDIFTCKLSDSFFIFLFCLIVIAPIASLFLGGDIVAGLPLFQRPVFWQALQMSVVLGVSSAILSTSMALILVAARYNASQLAFSRFTGGFLSLAMSVYLVLPSIVLGTASFMLLRAYIDVFSAAFWLVLMSNVFMTLPFATRILAGRYAGLAGQTDRLALALNLRGLRRFRLVVLPAMRHEIGLALGLCCAFSLGDFGVIALFGSEQFRTLPWLLYQYASRYGGAEAELLSLILLVLSIALYAGLYQMVRLYSRRVTGC